MMWDFVALVSHDAGGSATAAEVGVVCVVGRSPHPETCLYLKPLQL